MMDAKTIMEGYTYSPLSFLNRRQEALGADFLKALQSDVSSGELSCIKDGSGQTEIYYRALPWDTNYFKIPTYRIDFMHSLLMKGEGVASLENLLVTLDSQLSKLHGKYYIFAEIPSEGLTSLQALCLARWKLIETRLTYFSDKVQSHAYPKRFATKDATAEDIEPLRITAKACRNDFDRFHADFSFSEEVADEFLGTFIENSIKGYADITMIPEASDGAPDAFLTANLMPAEYCGDSAKIGKMILSAVGRSRRGWYVKLISEMTYRFKDLGIDLAFMTTQSTNRAVIKTWEKLGYSYGKSTHVFAMVSGGAK